MARLWQSGFELNSLTTGVEFTSIAGSPTIVTTPVRSGTYAMQIGSTGQKTVRHQYVAANSNSAAWARIYIYVTSMFTVSDKVICFQQTNTSDIAKIDLNTDGTLSLRTNSTTIGTSVATVPLNTWTRIELFADNTGGAGAFKVEGRLNGSVFSTTTTSANGFSFGVLAIGNGGTTGTGVAYIDDCALNDNSGSSQTAYPGVGRIIHLQPNAAGDSAQWTPTAGANYTNVDEITPNDATDLVNNATVNNSDMYNVLNSGLSSSDTVNVVAVGVRFNNDTADATTSFKVQIEKAASGTIAQSAAIIANSVTWKTNAIAVPWNYPLVTYADPDAAAWTPTTLDSMQIGVKTIAVGTNKNQVSTIWASVEYVEAAYSFATTVGTFTLTGISTGFSVGRKLITAVRTFALTGISATLARGLHAVTTVGAFALSGANILVHKTLTMAGTAASYVLTGIAVLMKQGQTTYNSPPDVVAAPIPQPVVRMSTLSAPIVEAGGQGQPKVYSHRPVDFSVSVGKNTSPTTKAL